VPPDTNGAVGASQLVEWLNVTFEVFGPDGYLFVAIFISLITLFSPATAAAFISMALFSCSETHDAIQGNSAVDRNDFYIMSICGQILIRQDTFANALR